MGIQKFNVIFKEYIENAKSVPDDKLSYTIHVDGNLSLFRGAISNCVEPHDIANNAFMTLSRLIHKMSITYKIDKVVIYFDGSPPIRKTTTIKKRACAVKFDVQAAMAHYKSLLQHDSLFHINQLEIGESEMQMILERDPSKPTILITNDSDVFHVAYEKAKNEAPLYLTNGNDYFINLSRFNVLGMPRSLFSALVILMGTDYTQNLLTPSMINTIISCYDKRDQDSMLLESFKNITSDSTTKPRHWRTILYEICNIIFRAKEVLNYKIYFGKKIYNKNVVNSPKLSWTESELVERWVQSLAWCARYNELGNKVDHYCNNQDDFEYIQGNNQWRLMRGAKSFGVGEITSWRAECTNNNISSNNMDVDVQQTEQKNEQEEKEEQEVQEEQEQSKQSPKIIQGSIYDYYFENEKEENEDEKDQESEKDNDDETNPKSCKIRRIEEVDDESSNDSVSILENYKLSSLFTEFDMNYLNRLNDKLE